MVQQKKILIIKFGALGDVLLASGQVGAIIKRHSGEKITILTEPAMMPLLKLIVHYGTKNKKTKIDFITVVRKHYWFLPFLILQLWFRNFYRVYDLQTSGYSNRLYYLLLVKPLWNGVVKNIWQDKSHNRDKIHAVERFNQQLVYAGINDIDLPHVNYLRGRQFSFFKKKFFILVIGGSLIKMRRKQILPLATYIAVAKFLEEKNIFSVIVGGNKEKKLGEEFSRAVPSAINLVGKTTLGDVAEIARYANGVVGNDTGITHLIALAKHTPRLIRYRKNKKSVPIIVIIAPPANPKVVRPLGDLKTSIRIIYRNNTKNITANDIINLLPKKL
ncbi:MAG: glycosyltransferase family 9 protein [Alphaproteobacteria bacterium]